MTKRRTRDEFDENLEAAVHAAYADASDYIHTEINPSRELAQLYFDSAPMGAEEEGRSQIIAPVVRETIRRMQPSLLRVFCGNEKAIEYVPHGPEDVKGAEQASDYIAYVLRQNDSYRLFSTLISDALLHKTGIVTWWWEVDERVKDDDYTGLSLMGLRLLQQERPDLGIIEATIHLGDMDPALAREIMPDILHAFLPEAEEAPAPAPGSQLTPAMPQMGATLPQDIRIDAKIRRVERNGRVRVAAIPPEEFLISRHARDIETAPYLARTMRRTVADLVALGYDYDELLEHGGDDNGASAWGSDLALVRNIFGSPMFGGLNDSNDDTQRTVQYTEHYLRHDANDGTGMDALYRICTIGSGCKIVHTEKVSEAPFAVWLAYPRPHQVIGDSVADDLLDLQRNKTETLRLTMDSLALSIHPRIAFAEGTVNASDLMNTETGALVRVKGTQIGDAIKPLDMPFVGQFSMPMVAYFDEEVAARSGVSDATSGLDPDVLQSTTKAAVTATIAGAQERLEMVARNLAETGMRPLARGLLRLICRHQDKPAMMRLRGAEGFVEVDPRAWNADMDAIPNVALGRGGDEQRVALLSQFLQLQQQFMSVAGPTNPVAGLKQVRAVIDQIATIGGIKDISPFFGAITPEIEAKLATPGPQKPSPEETLAQGQLAAAQEQSNAKMAIERAKLDLERERMRMDDDRLRDLAAVDAELKRAEIEARYGAQVRLAEIQAEVNRDRYAGQAALSAMQEGVYHDPNQPPEQPPGMPPEGAY